jgi:hypothetical protein
MVSRKSTKKTFWVLFFAIAVVILLGLFFFFYSGVYEGATTGCSIPYINNYLNTNSFFLSLSPTEQTNVKNYLDNMNSNNCKITIDIIVKKMDSKQADSIKNFALKCKSYDDANTKFNDLFDIVKPQASGLTQLKTKINLTITPSPTSKYKDLLLNFINKNFGSASSTNTIPTNLKNIYLLTNNTTTNKYTDDDYKIFYLQLNYYIQYITLLNSSTYQNLLKNTVTTNNSTKYLFYLLLIQANSLT